MRQIIITDFDGFRNKIDELEKSLFRMKEIFAKDSDSMKKIDNEEIWKGKTQQILVNKHKELKDNFPKIEETLEIYINFLKQTLLNYQSAEEKSNSNINNNQETLNVNA